jgi:hypothetical protein
MEAQEERGARSDAKPYDLRGGTRAAPTYGRRPLCPLIALAKFASGTAGAEARGAGAGRRLGIAGAPATAALAAGR